MKDFSRRDAIKLGAGALAAASLPNFARAKGLTGTNNIGLPLVPFTITNNTSQDVFMYAFGTLSPGSNPQINNYFVSNFNGDCKRFPVNAGPTMYGLKLPGPVTNASWPQLPGSRIYFSVGKKLVVSSTNGNGLPNAIVPNVSTDPNFNTLWDFVEANWGPGPDGNTVFQWNVTQVNAFALAFEQVLNGGTPSFPNVPLELTFGFGPGGLRAKIFAEIANAGAPWSNLIIPDPTPGNPPLRVLQPGYALTGVGVPTFPKDQLHDYVNNVVIPYYDEATKNRLIFANLAPPIWIGHTSGGKFIFEPMKDTTTTYTFNAPHTVDMYNNSFFGNPVDGNSNAIAAALGASILRSTLTFDPEFPVSQANRNLFYMHQPLFEYAKIIHKYALNNHAFCFGYDEVSQDAGESQQVWNPTSLALTIRRLT
jgi:hypothetical protein